MPKYKLFLVASCFILFIGNLISIYLLIDRSITLSYVRASADSTARSLEVLEIAMSYKWKNKSKQEIMKELQEISDKNKNYQIITKDDGEVVWLNDIPLKFSKGQLSEFGGSKLPAGNNID